MVEHNVSRIQLFVRCFEKQEIEQATCESLEKREIVVPLDLLCSFIVE